MSKLLYNKTYFNLDDFPRELGIVPRNALELRPKNDKTGSEETPSGIPPDSRLNCRLRFSRLESDWRLLGIVPVIKFCLNEIRVKDENVPIEEGMLPCSRAFSRTIAVTRPAEHWMPDQLDLLPEQTIVLGAFPVHFHPRYDGQDDGDKALAKSQKEEFS